MGLPIEKEKINGRVGKICLNLHENLNIILKNMVISVDLGGTNIRAALVDGRQILEKRAVACPAQESAATVIEALCNLIAPLMNEQVTGIGAGIPSVLDWKEGIVYNVANIPAWKTVPLKQMLEERFHVPVALNNDANCFALGVAQYGEGSAFQDFVGITLGTGVGAGIILGGRLYNGRNTGSGEIGSLPYLDSDYEHYCSSAFFTDKHGRTGKEFALAAEAGEEQALQVWEEFGYHLGKLIQAVMFAYDPEAVILGGSIAGAFRFFEKSLWKTVGEFPYPMSVERLRILPSNLNDAALWGAAGLCTE